VLSRRLPIDPKEIIDNEKFMRIIDEHNDYVTVQITKQDIVELDFYVMDMENQRQDIINRYIAENKLAPSYLDYENERDYVKYKGINDYAEIRIVAIDDDGDVVETHTFKTLLDEARYHITHNETPYRCYVPKNIYGYYHC